MQHRHIVTDGSVITVAAAESILDRGRDADFIALMRRLRKEPHSVSANNALVAAEASSSGNAEILKRCLAEWRGEGHEIQPARPR